LSSLVERIPEVHASTALLRIGGAPHVHRNHSLSCRIEFALRGISLVA
jgi:hypothetical protein